MMYVLDDVLGRRIDGGAVDMAKARLARAIGLGLVTVGGIVGIEQYFVDR
jgi:hypothetical protein